MANTFHAVGNDCNNALLTDVEFSARSFAVLLCGSHESIPRGSHNVTFSAYSILTFSHIICKENTILGKDNEEVNTT
eukprot:647252-Ditylum_brightwellii.AAC.1